MNKKSKSKIKFGKYNSVNNKSSEFKFDYSELESYGVGEIINISINEENTEYKIIKIVYKDENGIGIIDDENIFEFIPSDEDKNYCFKTLNNKSVPVALTIHYFDQSNGLLRMPVTYFQLKDSNIGDEFRINPPSKSTNMIDYYESWIQIIYKSEKGCLIKIVHLGKESGPNNKEIFYQWYNFT